MTDYRWVGDASSRVRGRCAGAACSFRVRRRGVFFRPVKRQLTLRLDADVIERFRRRAPNGEGYQTSINAVPREYVDQPSR